MFLLWLLGLGACVNSEGGVVISNLLDESLSVEISDQLSGNRSVDLELVAHFRNSDCQELGSVLGDSLVSLSVEEDGVVKLFLYLGLGPALLFSLTTTCFLSGEGRLGFALVPLGIFALGILLLCLLRNEK